MLKSVQSRDHAIVRVPNNAPDTAGESAHISYKL